MFDHPNLPGLASQGLKIQHGSEGEHAAVDHGSYQHNQRQLVISLGITQPVEVEPAQLATIETMSGSSVQRVPEETDAWEPRTFGQGGGDTMHQCRIG